MIFITRLEEWPDGFDIISRSDDWAPWLHASLPQTLDRGVRRILISNLKHILVGMDLKAALILTHINRQKEQRPVLYEPYLQGLVREFCNDAVSVLEGVGSALLIATEADGGSSGRRVHRNEWLASLCAAYDRTGEHGLEANIIRTIAVRDRIHQDRIGLRDQIDWHSFGYDEAFLPAAAAIKITFGTNAGVLPEKTYLYR